MSAPTPRKCASWALIALLLPLAACTPKEKVEPGTWRFADSGVVFEANFPRARLSECVAIGPEEFGVVVRPENLPVNNSPWFAFKVRAEREMPITVRLRCQGGTLRYRPKISLDGSQWVMLPEEAYQEGPGDHECTLRLEVGPKTLWVAAQELVSSEEMMAWAHTLERLPFVTCAHFGRSIKGKPMVRIDIGDPALPRHVSIIGRQHPPETTGSLALMQFVEEIAGDSELARRFRAEFHVLVMPLINPDGVDAGHWRHNMGHVDLNRDWSAFAQPETKAASAQIRHLAERGRLFLHLDFHSTFKDVFYTQPDEVTTSPPLFAKRWLAALQERVPEYEVSRSATRTPTPTTSAFWAHKNFAAPGITYEIGDNTERSLLRRVAAAAAQEMMRILLEEKDAPN